MIGTHTVVPASLPSILLAISLKERILIALVPGPQTMSMLSPAVGAKSQRVWKALDALHHERLVRRIGSRHLTWWALATYRGGIPKAASQSPSKKKRKALKREDRGSWWLVEETQFAAEARRRAEAMGWDK